MRVGLIDFAHRAEIDVVDARIYDALNNGVCKPGFAAKQCAYDEAVTGVFDTLDWLEDRLARQRYLVCDGLTEADIQLFTTLVRFDPVNYDHFKCKIRAQPEHVGEQNVPTRLKYLAQHPTSDLSASVAKQFSVLLRLECSYVLPFHALRQFPAGAHIVTGVAVWIALEIILMLGLGFPEVGGRRDLGHHLARPKM